MSGHELEQLIRRIDPDLPIETPEKEPDVRRVRGEAVVYFAEMKTGDRSVVVFNQAFPDDFGIPQQRVFPIADFDSEEDAVRAALSWALPKWP